MVTPITDHPQIRIEHGDFAAEVDEEIAPLLLDLWRLDLWTVLSCQDNDGGKVWIAFSDALAAERFVTIAAGDPKDEPEIESLYNRVVGAWQPEIDDEESFWKERVWRYDVNVDDFNVEFDFEAEVERRLGPPNIVLGISVRFPRGDLDEVAARVRAAVDARA